MYLNADIAVTKSEQTTTVPIPNTKEGSSKLENKESEKPANPTSTSNSTLPPPSTEITTTKSGCAIQGQFWIKNNKSMPCGRMDGDFKLKLFDEKQVCNSK